MVMYAEATNFTKAAMVVIPIAMVIHIIGFATDYWISYSTGNQGLWNNCTQPLGCLTYAELVYYYDIALPDWLKAVQAMNVLAIMLLVIAMIIIAAYFCMEPFPTNDRLIQLAAGTVILACLCLFIGIVVYAVKATAPVSSFDLDWSFILVIVAAIIALAGGILLICDQMCVKYHTAGDGSRVQPFYQRQGYVDQRDKQNSFERPRKNYDVNPEPRAERGGYRYSPPRKTPRPISTPRHKPNLNDYD